VIKKGGRIEFLVRLPLDRIGRSEPLIQSGVRGSADSLFIKYVSGTSAQIGFDRWGYGSFLSKEFTVDYSKPVTITADYGAFFPSSDPRSHRIRVLVNGAVVLDEETPFSPTSNGDIVFARNPLQMSTSDALFTGSVLFTTALP
jgi:hypothetical protein